MKRSGEGEQRNSSANLVGGGVLDAPQSHGNMKMWDDPRIIEATSVGAIELYAHAVTGTRLEPETGKTLFNLVSHVLARCYVQAIKANIEKENEEKQKESEGYYDDPNM